MSKPNIYDIKHSYRFILFPQKIYVSKNYGLPSHRWVWLKWVMFSYEYINRNNKSQWILIDRTVMN
jgi:hypothetical protein